MSQGRIGLTPVPDDEELVSFLQRVIVGDAAVLGETLDDLADTVAANDSEGNPSEFPYGSLMNYIASLPDPTRIHLLAAAIWKLYHATETDASAT